MGIQRLLMLGLAAGALGAPGSACAAFRITGMDLFSHGVVTSSQAPGPPVGAIDPFHISLTLFPPFPGGPWTAIPADATGAFNFSVEGGRGDLGFVVSIDDFGGTIFCQFCSARFSLVDGQLSGPFSFEAGVFLVSAAGVTDSFFVVRDEGHFSTPPHSYSGTFVLDRVAIHTDAPLPEPATWAMMVAGFLGVGQALRSIAKRSAPRATSAGLQ